MRRNQKLHEQQQAHMFGPCGFLLKEFHPIGAFFRLYDTPWDEKPRHVFLHSEECEEAYMRSGSFDYRECEGCDRFVCEQNPANGWHVQFRNHEDLGYICLRCYEKEILENGQPRSDYEGKSISGGMFFSGDNHEPLEAGFEQVPGFEYYFVQDSGSATKYNRKALSLVDSDHKVLTGYERLAIGGLEGYVTMFAKPHSSEL